MNIILLTNILTPYRRYFYQLLYESLLLKGDKFTVLVMANTESGRHWCYKDLALPCTKLLKGKTITISTIDFHFTNNLKKTLYDLKPDIVIVAGAYLLPPVWRAIQLKNKLNYRIFFWSESHLHETRNYNNLKLFIREKVRHFIFPKFDGFLYAGKLSLELIHKYEKPTALHYFCPNLIDENVYRKISNVYSKDDIRRKYKIDRDIFVFICPARLIQAKGIDKFLTIFDQCKYKEHAMILIPGDGEMKNKLITYIEEKSLNVNLMGYKSQNEMAELYHCADCFLLPSISDPNPLTCIEALWCGLPLLVSEHVGNYPEAIEAGKNGYVFSYKKPNEAINIIDILITSKSDWLDEARNSSLKIAEDKYSSKYVVERLIQELKK